MDEIDVFFGQAKSVCLTPKERLEIFSAFQPLLTESFRGVVRNPADARHNTPMSKTEKQFAGQARENVRLSPAEKVVSFRLIETFMKDHPYQGTHEVSERASFFDVLRGFRLMPVMASVLVLVIGLGGTASYAAESALPGDLFYPVKIYLNESIESGLAFSAEAKARTETRKAQRRLEEAEALALDARLDEARAIYLAARVEKHAAKARLHIETMQTSGHTEVADEINEEFETSLLAHDTVLQKVAHSRQGARREIAVLLKGVRAYAEISGQDGVLMAAYTETSDGNPKAVSMMMEQDVDSMEEGASSSVFAKAIVMDPKTEAKINEVTSRIAALRTSIEARSKSSAANEVETESAVKINQAETVIAEARIKMQSGSHDEANTLRKKSLRNVEEATVFLRIEQKLGASSGKKERNQAAATAQLRHAQKKMEAAKALIERAQQNAPDVPATVDVKLEDAKKKLTDAQLKLDASLFAESLELSKAALKLLAEIRVSLAGVGSVHIPTSDIEKRMEEARTKMEEKKEEALDKVDEKIQDILP